MEETILKEILQEMKGFREDNKSLKSEIEKLRNETNEQFSGLKQEFKELNAHQKGLKTSVEVLQYAINETRYELIKIKEYLATRVIGDNDSINIVAESGNVIYGTIKKVEKKSE
ncbi:MAG: hypothetical protein M0P61_07750 [Ignavibacteriaceae bacterium]|jgi:uncharacterized coiled-coil DUF342 family protein|nr:hypothetical protein [Ignavibacteriaceae bacterium]